MVDQAKERLGDAMDEIKDRGKDEMEDARIRGDESMKQHGDLGGTNLDQEATDEILGIRKDHEDTPDEVMDTIRDERNR